jgi:ribonuclease Y
MIFAGAIIGALLFRLAFFHGLQKHKLHTELDLEKKKHSAEIESKRIIEDAEVAIRASHRDLEQARCSFEHDKEALLSQKAELEEQKACLEKQKIEFLKQQNALDQTLAEYRTKLEGLIHADPQAIREELEELIQADAACDLAALRSQIMDRGEMEIRTEAQNLLITAMQRISSNPSTDTAATIVALPSEDMKGRIIGREGRNIRSFEAVTGTTLMIDETPETVLISAFDPVKREIAKTTLTSLLKDGRIHPSTIESAYEQAKESVLKNVQSLGEKAMLDLKLKPAAPEVLNLLGQLHFRHSFNQNCLDHSIEVAYIASMLASEVGLDPVIAKRGALFHDMGKAVDHEFEGSHALIGGRILRRFDEDPRVINAVEASHEEVPAESPYAPLVMIADKVSAMRPGARCDSLDSYVDRVKSLELIARKQTGVRDAFALQAGREVRVIVEPELIGDREAKKLASTITREIEDTLNYPSTIKVTVIREQRFCETAR